MERGSEAARALDVIGSLSCAKETPGLTEALAKHNIKPTKGTKSFIPPCRVVHQAEVLIAQDFRAT